MNAASMPRSSATATPPWAIRSPPRNSPTGWAPPGACPPACEASVRHHVGVDPAARHRRLADAVAVVARDHDRIALGIDAGDDADMTAAAAAHHRDGAD